MNWLMKGLTDLSFYEFIPSLFFHSIWWQKNAVALLFNGAPELKQTNSSFSRRTSKGFMYSFINVFTTVSWEFEMGDRVYKYYCLHPNHTNHTMLWCFLVLSDLSTIFLLIYYLCKMLLYHLMSLHHSLWSVLLSDQQ